MKWARIAWTATLQIDVKRRRHNERRGIRAGLKDLLLLPFGSVQLLERQQAGCCSLPDDPLLEQDWLQQLVPLIITSQEEFRFVKIADLRLVGVVAIHFGVHLNQRQRTAGAKPITNLIIDAMIIIIHSRRPIIWYRPRLLQ